MSPPDTTADEAKCEDLEKEVIGGTPKKFFQVGAQLPPQEKEESIDFFKRNIDVFAWDACDAPRIDPAFIYHRLNSSYGAKDGRKIGWGNLYARTPMLESVR